MRKIIIVFGLFLIFAAAQAQQPQTHSNADPNMKKGVSRTGNAKNGCDTARFVDRPGKFYDLPKVDRRGKRLKFHLDLENKVLGCGISDEEALLQVTIHWQSDTTDYMPKIIERGVKYWYDPNFEPPTGQSLGTVYHKVDESLNDDCSCDSVFYVMLDGLIPGTHYVTRAYVIKYSSNPSSADTLESQDLLITKERDKCSGWKRYAHETSADGSSIELVYDHEGNDYGVAQIGNQCWLRENIRCNTSPNGYLLEAPVNYANGDTIYYKVSEQVPYYYVFDALTISYRQRGNLYNWIAVVDSFGAVTKLPQGHRRGLCPEGWHVPNNEEWYELVNYVLDLGNKTLADFHNSAHPWIGDSVVKFSFGCGWPTDAQDGEHYSNANPGGYMDDAHVYLRNTTGFAAMPTNNVQESGKLGWVRGGTQMNIANYWLASPSETSSTYAYSWHIDEDQRGVSSFARTRKRGFSLRCLRDALTITPSPNVPQICVNEKVTYTPKVANESLEDFKFIWTVIDRMTGVTQYEASTLGSAPSFMFSPSDISQEANKYKIVCNATRNAVPNQGVTAMDLWDSVFVDVVVDGCQYLTVIPKKDKYCVGETVTITAHPVENHLSDIRWFVNNSPIAGANGTTLTYTFPYNQSANNLTYTFEFRANGTSDISESIDLIAVKALPSLAVCPDCDKEGFVIKENKNMGTSINVPYARWYVNTSHGDSTIAYAHAVNTVVPAVPGVTYSVAMVSSGGCHDTIRGLVLSPVSVPCEPVSGILDNEIPDANGKIVSVKDHENNEYAVIQIGNRCWMRENMRAISSPTQTNGRYDTILARDVSVGSNTAYQSYVSQVAHWYKNDSANYSKFGLLYNWCAAADVYKDTKVATATAASGNAWIATLTDNWRGICPEGWHLPSVRDWTELENDVFGNTDNAGKLAGSCDWVKSDALNSPGYYYRSAGDTWGLSGFDAIPGGEFVFNNNGVSTMQNVNYKVRFWTATQGSAASNVNFRGLTNNGSTIERALGTKNRGMSVRCVRNIPNWPPVMTVCYGIDPGVINITSHVDLDSVAWCRDGLTVSCKLSESQQVTLPPGKYAVKLYNNVNPTLCEELDSITINTICPKGGYSYPTEEDYSNDYNYIQSVKDREGNSYHVVEIGGKCWMRSNMRTKYDKDGNGLEDGYKSNTYGKTENITTTSYYYNISAANGGMSEEFCGYLYSWKAAKEICPKGWHLPRLGEWDTMYTYYNEKTAQMAAGCDVCTTCSNYWGSTSQNTVNAAGNYNAENRNVSGLSLVAAGNMESSGKYNYTSTTSVPSANLWAKPKTGDTPCRKVFDYNLNTMTERTSNNQNRAFSVRCVRDN